MRVAIIPARGGSKRIPRKNIKPFCGKPMIGWSIETAKACGLFDHIIVSTDDQEIAEVARSFGAEVPFMRPAELADDHAVTRVVMIHAIKEVAALYGLPAHVCCIYPTAPLMRADDLVKAFDLLVSSQRQFTFTLARYASPIQRALKMTPQGGVMMFDERYRKTRSQDLEDAYLDAGQFYWGRAQAFLDDLPTYSDHSMPYLIPSYRVRDIDTLDDWQVAEFLFEALQRAGL
jgi:pseudaminic acid cytidylyltransferase